MSLLHPHDPSAFTALFPDRPFGLRHDLADHPLLTLPRIVELVRELPRDRIEFNSGKAAISQDPNATPLIDLDPEDIVRQIETCGAWMVLKHIETHPAYRALVEDVLLSAARARGSETLADEGFEDIQGFIFVSSPNATTPFHADSDENIFLHVHGEKFFSVYDNEDRSIASEEALEGVVAKHRNLPYDPTFDARQTTYRLHAGDGLFVPYQWPHWVRTGDAYSVSLSLTWKSPSVRRRNDIAVFNSMLRGLGLPQSAPGANPALDAVKLAMFRTASVAVAPLRKSEALRRVLRGIALGKNANYYYRDKDKDKKAA
ncbi:MAG: cupin-like domain-containing protein [Pseudorhodoplanes sp.]